MTERASSIAATKEAQSRRLWGAAIAVGALVLLLLVGLLSLNIRERGGADAEADALALPSPKPHAAQAVGLQPIKAQSAHSESDLVAGEALFFDPSPLFLPTRWNAGAGGMPEMILQEAEELFEDYAPKLRFAREGIGGGLLGDEDLVATGASASAVAVRAVELAFSDEDSFAFSVIGRTAESPAPLPERGARLEVVAIAEPSWSAVATARRVIVRDLVPPAAFSAADNWRPIELAAVVDAAGLVGAVTLVRSSGVESVDEFFRNYVANELRLGERVGPGIYQILAGP